MLFFNTKPRKKESPVLVGNLWCLSPFFNLPEEKTLLECILAI